MARILTCDQCTQQFEVPIEHEAAPALQCPFCANIVMNVPGEASAQPDPLAQAGLGAATSEAKNPFPFAGKRQEPPVPAPDPTQAGPSYSGEAIITHSEPPPPANLAPANLMEEMARRLTEQESNIIIDGLPSEVGAGAGAVAQAGEEELVPEADPHMAGYSPYGAPAMPVSPGFPGQVGMMPNPMMPNPMMPNPMMPNPMMPVMQAMAPAARTPPEEEEDYSDSPDPLDYDDSSVEIQEIVELPEGTKLPTRGRGLLAFLVIVMLAGYAVILFTSVRNNGLFDFSNIGGSIAVMMGTAEPMIIAPPRVDGPKPNFEPVPTTAEKPNFRVATSPPRGFALNKSETDLVLVVYGNITNLTGQTYDRVTFEGVIKTSSGGELAISSKASVLTPDTLNSLGNAEEAVSRLGEFETMGEIEAFVANLQTQGYTQQLPSNDPKPFVVVFTKNVPPEVGGNHLFEIRVTSADLVP